MKKSVWMSKLERALSHVGLRGSEKRTVLNYYEEMYQDKREDGLSEEEIIREFGFPEDVAQNVRENEYRERRRDDRNFNENGYSGANSYNSFDYYGAQQPYRNEYGETPPPRRQYQNQANTAPKQEKFGAFSSLLDLIGALIRLAFVIALVCAGAGIAIGGLSAIVGSFFAITYNIGVWLAAFGIGIILFACGSLIFAAGIKTAKRFAPKGGVQ